jgi:hypothetical protein
MSEVCDFCHISAFKYITTVHRAKLISNLLSELHQYITGHLSLIG